MNNIYKILQILDKKDKKNLFFLILVILVNAFLESLGVASIFPFIALILNPDIINSNKIIYSLFQISKNFGINNEKDFIFFFGCSLFAFLLFSLSFKAFSSYLQIRFSLMKEYTIASKLLKKYLSEDFKWFLNRNSSELSKLILSEIHVIIYQTFVPIITLIAYGTVAITIIGALLIIDTNVTILVSTIFIFFYLIMYFLLKDKLSKFGETRLSSNKLRYKIISEIFTSFKYVKLSGLETFYLDQFNEPAKKFSSSQTKSEIIAQLPHFFLELLAFGGLILSALVIMSLNSDFVSFVPFLSMYAFAGYRLIPAFKLIYISFAHLKFSSKSFQSIYNDLTLNQKNNKKDNKLSDAQNNPSNNITFKRKLVLENISFKYLDNQKMVINKLNIEIPAYNKIGIIGTSGAGKTTLIDIITGLLVPTVGYVKLDDKILNNTNVKNWQKNIGYVPQDIFLIEDSLASNIALGVNKEDIDYDYMKKVCKLANIDDFIKSLTKGYDTKIGENSIRLSGGQTQRIGIARALYRKPSLIIFDEATSSLDYENEKIVMDSINNISNQTTIVQISHRLNTIKHCDKIYIIKNGSIFAEGTYQKLKELELVS